MATTVRESTELRLSPDEVFASLCDPAYLTRRADVNSSLKSEVQRHEVQGDEIHIVTLAAVPADWMPAKISHRIAGSTQAERYELWRRVGATLIGTMEFAIKGVPAQASGSMTVTPKNDGSNFVQHIEMSVDLPIVGKLIESTVARHIAGTLLREAHLFNNR